jgi:hypothetical protein
MIAPAFAQTSDAGVDIGGHITVLRLSEFDTTDIGVGVNMTWHATRIIALDGALTWFPGDQSASLGNRVARQQRTLGLVGARSGIRRGPVELFGRARVGFLRFASEDPAVCAAVSVVPPPLECHIAAGYTAFATDLGGGVAVDITDRLRIHADAGDLMVRYGLKAHRPNGRQTDGFTSHNLHVSSGLTLRF